MDISYFRYDKSKLACFVNVLQSFLAKKRKNIVVESGQTEAKGISPLAAFCVCSFRFCFTSVFSSHTLKCFLCQEKADS